MGSYIKFPATDVPSWVGFAVAVIVVVAIATHLPFVKKFV